MKKYLVAAGLVVAGLMPLVISPAMAAEFYVAKDATNKKCKIVNTKPDEKTMTMLGTSSYATKDEAKAALAKTTTDECPNKPTEFYVGKDPASKECKIVHKKPDGKKMIMVGTTSYPTEADAKAARSKTTPEECPRPAAKP
jgi:hypothetical protein